jgi:prevent-host-death family protein
VEERIRQSELRNNNAEIMRRVSDGESFTVTVHGRAVADLVPHQRERVRRRQLIPAEVLDQLIDAEGADPDPVAWARDIAEADELFGDDRPLDPWESRQE